MVGEIQRRLPRPLIMANTYVPDQSEQFKKSGMRLITDPASDVLLNRGKNKETSKIAHELPKSDGSLRES